MRIATFNVKDLFPARRPEHAPIVAKKLERLASDIRAARPDLLALQEIGDVTLLQRVADLLVDGAGLPLYTVVPGTPDERGIGNAIFVGKKLRLRNTQVHSCEVLPFPVFSEGDPRPFTLGLRRAVVEAEVDGPFGPLSLFCLHLKSNLPVKLKRAFDDAPFTSSRERAEGSVRALVLRTAEALFVRQLADARIAAGGDVVVAGAMNDVDGSVPVRTLKGDGEDRLVTVADRFPEHRRYSVIHRGGPMLIDHLLVSTRLVPALRSANVENTQLRDHGPFVREAPPSEDSDHALVWADIAAP